MATKVKMLSKVRNSEFRSELNGATPKAGEVVEVSKERADWLIERNYAQAVNAKGEVSAEANPGYGTDEAVQKATREASAQFGASGGTDTAAVNAEPDEKASKKAPSKK